MTDKHTITQKTTEGKDKEESMGIMNQAATSQAKQGDTNVGTALKATKHSINAAEGANTYKDLEDGD